MDAKTHRQLSLSVWTFGAAALAVAGWAPLRAQEAPTIDLSSPLAREMMSCLPIEDDAARLACFDAVAAPLAQAEADAEESAVKVLQGEGDWDSEVFTMEDPWHIAWSSEGSLLTIELHDGNGQLDDVVGNQIGGGEGTSPGLDPGTWRLAIRAVGAWQVRVVHGPAD